MNLRDLYLIRRAAGETLDDVARKTGLSVGYLNRIERGFIVEIKNHKKKMDLLAYLKAARPAAKNKLTKELNLL